MFNHRAKGRFGNQMIAYAVQVSIAYAWNNGTVIPAKENQDAYVFIPREMHKFIVSIFDSSTVELPVLENTYCNWPDINFKRFNGKYGMILRKREELRGETLMAFDGTNAFSADKHMTQFAGTFWREAVRYMRKTLRFRPKTMARVKMTLDKVKRRYKKFHPEFDEEKGDSLVYVALHNRRTDFATYSEVRFGKLGLPISYFYNGMNSYRYVV